MSNCNADTGNGVCVDTNLCECSSLAFDLPDCSSEYIYCIGECVNIFSFRTPCCAPRWRLTCPIAQVRKNCIGMRKHFPFPYALIVVFVAISCKLAQRSHANFYTFPFLVIITSLLRMSRQKFSRTLVCSVRRVLWDMLRFLKVFSF